MTSHLNFTMESIKARLLEVQHERPTKRIRDEIVLLRSKLDVLVNAPLPNGNNPFDALPDEMVTEILRLLPFQYLRVAVFGCVCRRWTRLMEKYAQTLRWDLYEKETLEPRAIALSPTQNTMDEVVLGTEDIVCVVNDYRVVKLWTKNTLSVVFEVDDGSVNAIALGPDNDVYVAWSKNQFGFALIERWRNNQRVGWEFMNANGLLVGRNNKVYVITVPQYDDWSIRLLSCFGSNVYDNLCGHAERIMVLAEGTTNGYIYSGSRDRTVRVWSGEDGSLVTILIGHAGHVLSVVAADKVYTGSRSEILIWLDHVCVNTIKVCGEYLAIDRTNRLFTRSDDRHKIIVRSCSDGTILKTIETPMGTIDKFLTTPNGTLVTRHYCSRKKSVLYVW